MEAATTALQLDDIGQIAFSVANLDEARAFYRDVLGMQFLFDAGAMSFFQCGSVRLLIGAKEQTAEPEARQGSETGGSTILYFRVSDIHATHATLRDKGVSFVQEPHLVARRKSHDLWLAFLKDPSGHTLALMSEVTRANAE